ncbi:hypothetical protein ACAG96_07865 [Candidatus Izemoplasma sp. B36]|uniref:hypothetical protein n=1 Tax=Candidatus Izemoplasma sp. B36 TaxID=3242468 RepID=UPI003558B154
MRTMMMSFFVLLCVLLTVFIYDLWDESIEEAQFAEVIALSQESTTTRLTSPSGKRLVPKGAILTGEDIDEIEVQYLVEMKENCKLNVYVKDVFFKKNNEIFRDDRDSLSFNFDIEEINESQARVTVLVQLNMPKDKDHYELIKNSSISFNLVFDHELITQKESN